MKKYTFTVSLLLTSMLLFTTAYSQNLCFDMQSLITSNRCIAETIKETKSVLPIYKTDTITCYDLMHYDEQYNDSFELEDYMYSYTVTDKKSINKLVKALSKGPSYESDAAFRSMFPIYCLDFHNGTQIYVESRDIYRIFIDNKDTGTYQLTMEASMAIEQFILENIDMNTIQHNDWWYYNDPDFMYSAYITTNYLHDDYSSVVDYMYSIDNSGKIYDCSYNESIGKLFITVLNPDDKTVMDRYIVNLDVYMMGGIVYTHGLQLAAAYFNNK